MDECADCHSVLDLATGPIGGNMFDSPVMLILLALDFFATWAFAEVSKEKGYPNEISSVWLLGIFGTFFAAGLYVEALPDKYARPVARPLADSPHSHDLEQSGSDDELPNS